MLILSFSLSVGTSMEPMTAAAACTWLLGARSVATTVRITLPGAAVMARTQSGSWHPSSARNAAMSGSGLSSLYCSMVMVAFNVMVTSEAATICSIAPGGRGGGGGVDGGDGGGGGGGGEGPCGDGSGGSGEGDGGGGDGGGEGDGGSGGGGGGGNDDEGW